MVDKLNTKQPRDIIYKEKMAGLAMEIGLNQVVRWKPGKVGLLGTVIWALLTFYATAREPRGLRPDSGADHMSVCHHRCDWPAARCRGGSQGGQGTNSEQDRHHEGVVAIASDSNCINLYHITLAGTLYMPDESTCSDTGGSRMCMSKTDNTLDRRNSDSWLMQIRIIRATTAGDATATTDDPDSPSIPHHPSSWNRISTTSIGRFPTTIHRSPSRNCLPFPMRKRRYTSSSGDSPTSSHRAPVHASGGTQSS